MACEACNVKFSFFTRKKQCMDCLRYFCSECVIKRLDKILSCDSCNMLSRRPLIRSLIVQTRSKDMRQYLLAKKVPIKGCIEKEDLIKLLMTFANGNNNYWNTESTENTRRENVNSQPNQSVTRNHEYSGQVPNYVHETNATRSDCNEIPGTISGINIYSDERTEPIHQEEEKISNIANNQHSCVSIKSPMNPVKLSDINTLSELEHLSVKQLKNLLSTNRVDYKGCIERCELLNKASRLWKEYEQSRTAEMEILDENLCKVCWDEPIECVILECGHMVCCLNCGKQMSECPICKQYVVRIIRFFKS
ncbi:PREDICTED: E3 ubiquitin-protein ligase RNF34 isoform X2 [Eufriesea mexicana]|uniref:E3 ubiquitin-protein ligase RNF34 isoform X2 n=1 Tax=Eufriesea mexicana TaxID=516756 RepID=UPI00083BF3EB|nr:PREDICTED: E3 ubiquitin-protein ligase RNF34 isoform X2 [Eufriesea mexicana]